MRAIMAARPRGCHFLLVGDVHQLPPVGNGAPLRDMINSGVVGYGELTEIKRNSGGIVEACAAIRDGKPWDEAENLIVDPFADQIQAARIHCQKGHPKLDAVWDCQVLVAVNARSPLSRKAINLELQNALNPNPEVKGTPFRLADKIVCLKNGKYTEINDREEVYVANGELAKVIEIEDKSIIAELSNPARTVRIPRGKADGESSGCNWDLAYGLSCHKSQGSEWPVVIVVLDEYPGARMVCSREWLYTAISRAKKQCILIGKKATADAMCRRVAIGKRQTFLRQLIQLENATQTLELIR
jgi:exodeoxyribonuclease V alpha subunit